MVQPFKNKIFSRPALIPLARRPSPTPMNIVIISSFINNRRPVQSKGFPSSKDYLPYRKPLWKWPANCGIPRFFAGLPTIDEPYLLCPPSHMMSQMPSEHASSPQPHSDMKHRQPRLPPTLALNAMKSVPLTIRTPRFTTLVRSSTSPYRALLL